jgi:HupE / UreJ protein
LAAFGFVHLPTRPVEVLIALSILVSAVHALRPIFPGKETAIAAFVGLFHGLAFASTLSDLGLARWERVAGILAFNLGIETMQVAVVAAILPSLLLMSRTRAYPFLRSFGVWQTWKSEKTLFFASPTHHKNVILRACDFFAFAQKRLLSLERGVVDGKGVLAAQQLPYPLATVLSLSTTLSFLSSRAYPDFLLRSSHRCHLSPFYNHFPFVILSEAPHRFIA